MYTRREWTLLALIFSGGAISYMDRAAFGVLAPLLQEDLALDPAQMGLALSCFSLGYTLFTFIGGYLTDRIGAKRVLAAAMTVWSAFCALTGAVGGFATLLAVRFAFGAGEAPFTPATSKITHAWFPAKRFAGAVGLSNAGLPLGGALAGPLVGVLAASWGWRAAFVLIGAIGVTWLLAWLWLARERPGGGVTPAAQGPAPAETEASASLLQAIAHRNVTAAAAGFFAYGYLLYFFLSWFPSYLAKNLGMDLKTMGLATAAPWAAGALGLIAGGFASDHLARRLNDEARARKLMIVWALAAAAVCVALAPQFRTPATALPLMAAAIFFMYVTGANYTPLAAASVPERHLGGVTGYLVFVANIAGIAAPFVTGLIVKATGDFTAAFLLAGAIVIAGAAAVALLSSAKLRPAGAAA
ncbi:MAG: MFS transporter [Hyphomonadaceae bacterium]